MCWLTTPLFSILGHSCVFFVAGCLEDGSKIRVPWVLVTIYIWNRTTIHLFLFCFSILFVWEGRLNRLCILIPILVLVLLVCMKKNFESMGFKCRSGSKAIVWWSSDFLEVFMLFQNSLFPKSQNANASFRSTLHNQQTTSKAWQRPREVSDQWDGERVLVLRSNAVLQRNFHPFEFIRTDLRRSCNIQHVPLKCKSTASPAYKSCQLQFWSCGALRANIDLKMRGWGGHGIKCNRKWGDYLILVCFCRFFPSLHIFTKKPHYCTSFLFKPWVGTSLLKHKIN